MVLITLSEFWASNLTFWAATYARQSRQSVCLYYFWKPSMDMIWSSSSAAPSQHTIITTEWLFGTHPKFTQVGKTKSKQKNEIDTVVVKEEDNKIRQVSLSVVTVLVLTRETIHISSSGRWPICIAFPFNAAIRLHCDAAININQVIHRAMLTDTSQVLKRSPKSNSTGDSPLGQLSSSARKSMRRRESHDWCPLGEQWAEGKIYNWPLLVPLTTNECTAAGQRKKDDRARNQSLGASTSASSVVKGKSKANWKAPGEKRCSLM